LLTNQFKIRSWFFIIWNFDKICFLPHKITNTKKIYFLWKNVNYSIFGRHLEINLKFKKHFGFSNKILNFWEKFLNFFRSNKETDEKENRLKIRFDPKTNFRRHFRSRPKKYFLNFQIFFIMLPQNGFLSVKNTHFDVNYCNFLKAR
jgi:hypothetical protein